MDTSGTVSSARQAGDSDGLEALARVGLIAYGIVHLLVAWLALQLAWGGGGGSADQSGAMATLAEQPFGKPLLWVLAIGLLALAVWQLAELFRQVPGLRGSGERKKKAVTGSAKSVAKAAVYVFLAITALRFATGSGQSSSSQQQDTVAGVFGWPGGRFLVGAAALVLIGVGAYHVRKGLTKHFLKEIDTAQASAGERRLIERLGQVGYPAKGIALALVGGLVGWAAVTFDPEKASGLDGALRTLLDAPFGKALLTVVALGIAAFGVFAFFRARYPQRT
ncbi:DUF1206 domain-containing protein [Modestobacter versicolor]|uniref:DUF1206 domain-containing protein n=1 Tax=Modestobacter versicolor TaxID=429133 RepID=A0A323V330_9ACTN|nr:DUF1206 domain-containing protein [Modestobacter versicolor]MBB3674292.1 hypothetical protein [Modestobacter versicolor]PZA19229.1 DUF1206 domain-containing protein [Modestobacter versicolor]